jgi:hypothetical protein
MQGCSNTLYKEAYLSYSKMTLNQLQLARIIYQFDLKLSNLQIFHFEIILSCNMCPPADQTERSGQQWSLMIPGLKMQLPMASIMSEAAKYRTAPQFMRSLYDGYPRQYFKEQLGWSASTFLARPENISTQIRCSRTRNGQSLSRIERLPSELLTQIVADDTLEATDVIALGLTCDILWVHVLRHVSCLTRKQAGLLSGEKMALLGTHLRDLPLPFEQGKFMKSTVVYPRNPFGNMCEARRVNWWAWRHYEKISCKSPQQEWMAAYEKARLDGSISSNWAKALENELHFYTSVFRGNHGQWMLRNLDTNEFVRVSPGPGQDLNAVFVDHATVKDLSIDHLLFVNISWGKLRPRPYGESLMAEVSQGPWAGHSFDIVPLDRSGQPNASWIDVTERIVENATKHLDQATSGLQHVYPKTKLGQKRGPSETPPRQSSKASKFRRPRRQT